MVQHLILATFKGTSRSALSGLAWQIIGSIVPPRKQMPIHIAHRSGDCSIALFLRIPL